MALFGSGSSPRLITNKAKEESLPVNGRLIAYVPIAKRLSAVSTRDGYEADFIVQGI